MVVVRPDFVDEMPGDPPIYPIGCVGSVTESQQLPDGRYDIVLRGESRFRVLGEEPRSEPRLYRTARIAALPELYDDGDHERVARLRASIIESVGVLVREAQPEHTAANWLSYCRVVRSRVAAADDWLPKSGAGKHGWLVNAQPQAASMRRLLSASPCRASSVLICLRAACT